MKWRPPFRPYEILALIVAFGLCYLIFSLDFGYRSTISAIMSFGGTALIWCVCIYLIRSREHPGLRILQARSSFLEEGIMPTKESVVAHYGKHWDFSASEVEVMLFVAKGFSNAEIAKLRGTANTTTKTQVSQIFAKSGLGTRYQVIAFVNDEVCDLLCQQLQAERNKQQQAITTKDAVRRPVRSPAVFPTHSHSTVCLVWA